MTIERNRYNKPQKFDELRRVVTAVSKDETRYFMGFLRAEEHWCIATDGRRLHMCPNTFAIPPGSYKVLKRTKTKLEITQVPGDEAGMFPNWHRVIPDAGTLTRHLEWKAGGAKSEIILHHFAAIDSAYLADLEKETYEVGFRDPAKAVTFTTGDFLAVIMPIRIDDATQAETGGQATAEILSRVQA